MIYLTPTIKEKEIKLVDINDATYIIRLVSLDKEFIGDDGSYWRIFDSSCVRRKTPALITIELLHTKKIISYNLFDELSSLIKIFEKYDIKVLWNKSLNNFI